MTQKINHKELNSLIKHYYNSKIALFIWGKFGIGKSAVVKDTAKELAIERKREFVEWNKLTKEEKEKVLTNCERYFVLIDIRLSEYDSSDIKGLPNFKGDRKSIEFLVPFWALLLEKENSDGILFFDEINLAVPLVQSSCYKIIYDRVVNDSKINKNWLIIGAGNIEEDRAYTHEIAPPLRDRGGEVELVGCSVEDWTNWALKNGIDGRIIGFLHFKTSNIYKVDYEDKQKFTTYRGWERVSCLIKDVKDYKILDLITSSAISEGIAKEFIAFCKIKEEINLDELIKNPHKLKTIKEINIRYFIVTALADRYKDNKIKFEKIKEISKILDEDKNAEFVTLLWRMCYGYNPKKFEKDFLTIDMDKDKEFTKYSKYLT